MKNKHIFCVALFFLLFPSCRNQFADETSNFQKYLGDTFQEKIPESNHTFLLISSFRCSGCVENALFKISRKTDKNSTNKITILTFDSSLIPDTLRSNFKILSDNKTGYEKIGISIANIALIKTSEGKIDKIRIINLDETDQIVKDEF